MLKYAGIAVVAMSVALGGQGATVSKDKTKPKVKVPAELLKAKLEAARVTLAGIQERYGAGRADEAQLYLWSRRVLEAEMAVSARPANRKAAYAAHLDRMKLCEKIAKGRFDAGQLTQDQLAAARYYRLEAEIWLVEMKGSK